MVSLSSAVASAATFFVFAMGVAASPNPNPDPMPTPNPDPAPQLIPSPTASYAMSALTSVGCFSTPTPMVDHGPYTFQSKGNCQPICWGLSMPVMGLVNGTNCWCGSLLPPNNTQVPDDQCSTTCNGIDTEFCGGDNKWTVYLTGFTRNHIANLDPNSVSSSSKPSKTAEQTVVVTAAPKKSGGGSSVGIAIGVVVTVVALGAIAVGVFLFLRKKKQREEENKKYSDIQSFVGAGKVDNSRPQMWAQDSRLDSAGLDRRQSNGSIADNQDYSRRILQVRNPDGF